MTEIQANLGNDPNEDSSQKLFDDLQRWRTGVQPEQLVPAALPIALIDLAYGLHLRNRHLIFLNAFSEHSRRKRPAGRPKAIKPAKVRGKRGPRGRGFAEHADLFIENLPQVLLSSGFERWRSERGQNRSEKSAVTYMLELALHGLGEGKYHAPEHVKSMQNAISKLRGLSQNSR